MISLGGTIGAGLFIGIAEPLTQAGPLGTILAYFAAGLVMLGTMMCLGELATSFPHSGSFQYYAYKFFPSPLISYTIGWMYWLSWVFALAAGLVAAGIVSHEMWPNIPIWLYCGGYLAILTLVNMLSAGAFGEFEYWLAGIKVFAIVFNRMGADTAGGGGTLPIRHCPDFSVYGHRGVLISGGGISRQCGQ